ncbi:MAG: hypothetical protein JST08_01220 [Actinobacteria bacterium]|nr:hypothetical protein [Actinomycetota bacterium]
MRFASEGRDRCTIGWHNSDMNDDELVRIPDGDADSASDIVPGSRIDGEDWRLWIDDDGWYLAEGGAPGRRVSVAEAIEISRRRAGVFRATRQFLAVIGGQLAEGAWVDPIGPGHEEARSRGLDPKLPSEQIAAAGRVIARLGEELGAAEAVR